MKLAIIYLKRDWENINLDLATDEKLLNCPDTDQPLKDYLNLRIKKNKKAIISIEKAIEYLTNLKQ